MKALIIVDVQNDFCQGGSLEVKNSNQIFPFINQLVKREEFTKIFVTKDWHPISHSSFAINHGKQPFEKIIDQNGQEQLVWPTHCVQYTKGAQLSPFLDLDNRKYIEIRKGYIQNEESYSGFGTQKNPTKLQKLLKKNHIQQVVVVGLALDFCVGNTALDAAREGLRVTVVQQATKSVNKASAQLMIKKFMQKGVNYINYRKMTQNSQLTFESSDGSQVQASNQN